MNKTSIILVFLIVLHFFGCEEIPNGVIEEKRVDYIVESIESPNQFNYSETNKSIDASIIIKNVSSVERVWFNIVSFNGSEDISINNLMTESQNDEISTFTGTSQFNENLLSGSYILEFYVEDNVNNSDENVNKVGSKKLEYFGIMENVAPVIRNLQLIDQVNRGEEFIFSIAASDSNGLEDIENVYFELNRPDGTIVFTDQANSITKFKMFDNGDTENSGDQTEGDGVFSLKNSFGQTSQTGDWTFTFGAIDKSGAVSNIIIQKLKVN